MATAAHTPPFSTPVARTTLFSRPLVLWHLLSLDAPTIAALWTIAVARLGHVTLPLVAPAAMFVAVWMLYAADRLLDSLQPSSELEARHHFHHRHRVGFLTGITFAAIALVVLDRFCNPEALRLYALLGSLLAAWFVLIHARIGLRRLPKEIAVGLFFSAAVFIPTVARRPDLRLTLAPHALLLAALCSLNCLFIYAWEHSGPRLRAHWTTRHATQRLPLLASLTLAAATLLAVITRSSGLWLLDSACALSLAVLLALHRNRAAFQPVTLRAAADLALLTPLLLLFVRSL